MVVFEDKYQQHSEILMLLHQTHQIQHHIKEVVV